MSDTLTASFRPLSIRSMIACFSASGPYSLNLTVADPAPEWPPPPKDFMILADVDAVDAAAGDDRAAGVGLVGEDDEDRIDVDDLAVHVDDVGQRHHLVVEPDDIDRHRAVVEPALVGPLHQLEQDLLLLFLVGRVEEKPGDMEIGPVFQQIGGGVGVLGRGRGVGEVAGVLVQSDQHDRRHERREVHDPFFQFPHHQGDGGADGLLAAPVVVNIATVEVVVPEVDLEIVAVLQPVHPVQLLPPVGIDDDQGVDQVGFDLMRQDDVEGGLVRGQEAGDVGVDHLGNHAYRIGVEQGSGDDRGQSVKIGVFMGGYDLHTVKWRSPAGEWMSIAACAVGRSLPLPSSFPYHRIQRGFNNGKHTAPDGSRRRWSGGDSMLPGTPSPRPGSTGETGYFTPVAGS